MNRLVLALLSLGLALSARAETHYYLVQTIAQQSPRAADRAQAHELARIYDDLAHAAGVDAKLVWSTDPDINAFATEVGGDKIVVVQEGLLAQMDGDRDAVAAVLGHELAHHKCDHIRKGKKKQEGARVLGAILGAVVGAKVGRNAGDLAGAATAAAVGVGASLVALKFNRDQEMEADRLAVGWMIDAGYNPDGMLRLQRKLGELSAGKRQAAIFSTHPTSAKRYEAAQKQIAKLAPPPELLARDVAPLASADALASATAEIKKVEDDRVAQALKIDAPEVAAEALVPVEQVDFDTYAALENQIQFSGDKGKASLLKKNKLNDAQWDNVQGTFSARMTANPALRTRFSVAYFRAAQGPLAAYGRDLADSYEKSQPPQLDPPYPLETGAQIFADMRARGAPQLTDEQEAAAEKEVLKPHGLSYYDFLIAHNWWARKAKVAAASGDTSMLRVYFGLEKAAEKSNVHIGDNVHVGDKH